MTTKHFIGAIAGALLLGAIPQIAGAVDQQARFEQQRQITDGSPNAVPAPRGPSVFEGAALSQPAPATGAKGDEFFERARRATDGSPK